MLAAAVSFTSALRSAIGPTVIDGLPAHPLLVHFVVVLVPLAAIALVVSATWPAFRRRLGLITPLLGVAAVISVPLATNSGEWFVERIAVTDAVIRHAELGLGLLWWVVSLAVFAVLVWATGFWTERRTAERDTPGKTTRVVLRRLVMFAVIAGAIASSIGSIVHVYQVGDSGARAVWTGVVRQR